MFMPAAKTLGSWTAEALMTDAANIMQAAVPGAEALL